MKKIYQKPEIMIVKVQASQMIAASVEGFNEALGSNEDGDDGNEALGRRGSGFWDDEE